MPDGILMEGLRGECRVICESREETGFSVPAKWKVVSLCGFSSRVRLQVSSRKEQSGFDASGFWLLIPVS